jgi:thioredoxin-like negative regulator of GroEL
MQPDLFEKYAATTMVAPAERGEATDDPLQLAVAAFNAKDYTVASYHLTQARIKDTTSSFVNFYYGVSLLQTNRIAEAREMFNQLYAGQSAFKYEAAFYQALTFLKEDNKALCKEWLQKIPADALTYSKAQELLKKL